MQKIRQHPILILLIINIVVGLFTFRNYGLSWDEPLFYDYANSLPYAYSPREWFSGNFNLDNAFGSSGTDHANRGPAYILIAHPFVSLLESLNLDNASAWHLINFLTFQLGVYLLYRLSKRWLNNSAALATAALFAWQPLLWGHAFINPKDPPFLVFFLGAVCFGFEMVDNIAQDGVLAAEDGGKSNLNEIDSARSAKPAIFRAPFIKLLAAGFFLGIATSIRVLGPLAGLLVGIYALSQFKKIALPVLIKHLAIYATLAILIAFITWPYLWTNPLQRFVEAFGFMSDNPTQLQVLFNGQLYHADELPRRYLPVLLSLTLTEPAFPLFFIGLFITFWKIRPLGLHLPWRAVPGKPPAQHMEALRADERPLTTDYWSLITILLWFIVPFAYVILRKPPMYDGYRHFLFMLPPLFIFAGFAFEKLFYVLKTRWVMATLVFILLAPAIYNIIQLHPYQYTYYNSFIGGTSSAFRVYETDYWLTCYKEAIEEFNAPKAQLFIKREPAIAAYYVGGNITIRDYRVEFSGIRSGDFVLVNTRANEDIKTFKEAPVVLQISRGSAVFCEIKQIP